jgi:hypothetical protein
LLWDSPHLLWFSHGTARWGKEAALARVQGREPNVSVVVGQTTAVATSRGQVGCGGKWFLDPGMTNFKVVTLSDRVAEVFSPAILVPEAANPGMAMRVQPQQFLIYQMLVKTGAGWRVATMVPYPVTGGWVNMNC